MKVEVPMNLREAVKAEISPTANRRRVAAYRAQESPSRHSYTEATDVSSNKRGSAKKIIEERRALG
jgi:hypothetical protein